MIQLLDHLDKLHAFVTIADAGSLQSAARQLRKSQPALSQKIRTIEDVVNQQLFTRSVRGVQLTDAGHKLYKFARRTIRDAEEFSFTVGPERSRLRIGTYDVIAQMIAHDLAAADRLVDLTILTERSGLAVLERLRRDEIDIALVDDPPRIPSFNYRELVGAPFGLYAVPALQKRIKSARDPRRVLSESPLIYVPGTMIAATDQRSEAPKAIIDSFVEQEGLGQGLRIKVDSYLLAIDLALKGRGVGLLITGHILELLRNKQLVEVPLAGRKPRASPLYIVTRSERDQSELAAAIAIIHDVFKRAIDLYCATTKRT